MSMMFSSKIFKFWLLFAADDVLSFFTGGCGYDVEKVNSVAVAPFQ